MGSNDTLSVVILRLSPRPVQGWPPAGLRMVGLGQALETLANPNQISFLTDFEAMCNLKTVIALRAATA
jgi:hypothetical protein